MKAHASLANEENKEKGEIREAASHMPMAGDARTIKSKHMLKVDAALVQHPGSIDACFNTTDQPLTVCVWLTARLQGLERSYYGLPSNLHSYRLDG